MQDTIQTQNSFNLLLPYAFVLTAHTQQAFYHGRLPVARMLLNKKANMEAKDIYGATASHLAIDANQFEILKFALENGADIEATDACGWTLLMRAVLMNSDLNIVKLLVTSGAGIESKDMNDLNCQDLAQLYRNNKAVEYFQKLVSQSKRNI